MNANDILSLVNAGFTKSEILQMFPQDPAPAEDQPAAVPDQAPAAPPEQPAPQAVPAADGMQQLFQQMAALTSAIQAQNRAYAEQGTEIIEPYAQGVNTLRGLADIPTK